MIRTGQVGLKLSGLVWYNQDWSGMIWSAQKLSGWSGMIRTGQVQSGMVRNDQAGQEGSGLVRNAQRIQKFIKSKSLTHTNSLKLSYRQEDAGEIYWGNI